MPLARFTLLVVALSSSPGCGTPTDRLRDLSDIIDLKGGTRVGFNLGAKVEPTDFFQIGVGYARTGYEFIGRRLMWDGIAFGKGGYEYPTVASEYCFGIGSLEMGGTNSALDVCPFGLNLMAFDAFSPKGWKRVRGVPLVSEIWRIGGEIWLPFVTGGIYFNAGEFVDFLGGFVGWDPAVDDGLPIATDYRTVTREKDASAVKPDWHPRGQPTPPPSSQD